MKTKEEYEAALNFVSDHDLSDQVSWHNVSERNDLWPHIDCSDFFFWGCSDLEVFEVGDLPEIERAIDECEKAKEYAGDSWGPRLWIARKRQARPQGAFYAGSGYGEKQGELNRSGIPVELRGLFNACGDYRPAAPGNPYATPEVA